MQTFTFHVGQTSIIFFPKNKKMRITHLGNIEDRMYHVKENVEKFFEISGYFDSLKEKYSFKEEGSPDYFYQIVFEVPEVEKELRLLY